MELPTEIPTIWLIGGLVAVVSPVIMFFSIIIGVYRSIIARVDDGLGELNTKIDAGFKEIRETLNTAVGRIDNKIDEGLGMKQNKN